MIDPKQTFNYRFEVQKAGSSSRGIGTGACFGVFPDFEPLAGSNPTFELDSGWLSLFPTAGWARSLPTRSFSDQPHPSSMDEQARLADMKSYHELFLQAQKESWEEADERVPPGADVEERLKEQQVAFERALRRRGITRDLASFSLFVGEALAGALQTGDELRYSRDGNGDFRFSVERDAQTVFSAGTVSRSDSASPIAIWQEYDRRPNPNAEALKKERPTLNVAEWIYLPKPYVTARIKDQQFRLVDGEEAQVESYYVFLARSNRNVPALAFEFTSRAVHAAGRLDVLTKEQIIDAAQTLTRPQVRLL
jgi:hypothetical protein